MIMFKKKKAAPNQYVPTPTPTALSALQRKHQTALPWWATKKAIIGLTIFFTLADLAVLYSLINHSMSELPILNKMTSLAAAFLLNLLPVVAVSLLKRRMNRTHKLCAVFAIAMLTAFLVVFYGSVMLRLANEDMFETESLVNSVSVSQTQETEDQSSSSTHAMVIFLCLMPLGTSILNAGLAWIAPDEVETGLQDTEQRALELQQEIADLTGALEAMEPDISRLWAQEEENYRAAQDLIHSRVQLMKGIARTKLAVHLKSPQATSQIIASGLAELRGQAPSAQSVPQSLPRREGRSHSVTTTAS
jgi:hypothetical protein